MTLSDDVAAALKRLSKERGQSLKDLANDALRIGLKQMGGRSREAEPCRTRAVDLGPCLIGDLDNIGKVLAIAEGEAFK